MADLAIRDRVYIAARSEHPWAGSSGVIVARFGRAGLDWEVELDEGEYRGHRVAAASSDLRPERRRSRR